MSSLEHLKNVFILLFLALIASTNICVLLYLHQTQPGVSEKPVQHSYLGDDHPQTLPIDLSNPILFPYTEEGEYLPLSDEPDALAAWEVLMGPGKSFVHLGPNNRRFSVSMFHQLHCLLQFRAALPHGSTHPHLTHCLNYLTHAVLCHADITLEPETDPPVLQAGVPMINAFNVTHTCRDWKKVYEYMERMYWD